jgi:hypothetical protein
MNGYVKNKSAVWRHAMKRTIGPGHKIPLDELFEQYGKKHDLQEGASFAEWLRNVKLRDSTVWEVVFNEDTKESVVKTPKGKKNKEEVEEVIDNIQAAQMVVPFVKSAKTPADLVNLTVRDARQELKKTTDLDLLKYAYNEARQLANKDSLCILMKRRIQELELTRR